jgi:hypothetical protein
VKYEKPSMVRVMGFDFAPDATSGVVCRLCSCCHGCR